MKKSQTLSLIALAFTTFAVAAEPPRTNPPTTPTTPPASREIKLAFGKGVLTQPNTTRKAEFGFEVGKKKNKNDQYVNFGKFEFATPGENKTAISFRFENPTTMTINADGILSLAGRGAMNVKAGKTSTVTPVMITLSMRDLFVAPKKTEGTTTGAPPGNDLPKDTLAIQVTTIPAVGTTTVTTLFQGEFVVSRGDIVIRRPEGGTVVPPNPTVP